MILPWPRFSLRTLLLGLAAASIIIAVAAPRLNKGLRCSSQDLNEPALGRRPLSTRVVIHRSLTGDRLRCVFVQLPNYSLSNDGSPQAGSPSPHGISFRRDGVYLHGKIVKLTAAPSVLLYDPLEDALLQIPIREPVNGNRIQDIAATPTWRKEVVPRTKELAAQYHAHLEHRNGRKLAPTW